MKINEFVAKHGFTDTPAGERMAADLQRMMHSEYNKGVAEGGGGLSSVCPVTGMLWYPSD